MTEHMKLVQFCDQLTKLITAAKIQGISPEKLARELQIAAEELLDGEE